ncbi:FUSC family protein [Streptomyces sp. NPDC012888]|uniref:FUSC family protein n=1 Tax=Streptomyces sp. NPDC012888 TaxID=3364855 RepID=UPI0036A96B77
MAGDRTAPLGARYGGAARRAARVTVAAGTGFYLFLYGFGSATAATYALFTAVSLAALAHIPGTGRQRAALMLRVAPWCWLLVALGTFLAVRTWSAVAGMLVIGFALAFVAVGGPRAAGAAPGLQLLYILPSFPPYDPGSLGERLGGATVGLVLIAVAEAFLFPDPPPVPYRARAAGAVRLAGVCAGRLAEPPYALDAREAREALEAGAALRPSRVAEADRPAGPGVRDRALSHTGLATRTLLNRLALLPAPPAGREPSAPVRAALAAVARGAAEAAEALEAGADGGVAKRGAVGGGAGGAREDLARARAELVAAARPGLPAAELRRHAAVLEVADAGLAVWTASRIAVEGRAGAAVAAPGRFWYARLPAWRLWWHRLLGHAGRRSVFFQNAVRISLALAAARLVAGVDSLPHGFWALLATLTLTRTTVAETRVTVRRALTGTLVGAVVAALLITVVGTHTDVYAAALPVLMMVAFTVGPVRGIGWAQGGFTVVIAFVFAQLAPATWQLAELRLLEVLTGSAIGAVFGLLAWPRGAHEEMRRSAAVLLRVAAETVVATAAAVAAGGRREPRSTAPGHRSFQHALIMAESAFAQYLSEPRSLASGAAAGAGAPPHMAGAPAEPDWQAALMLGHHTLWGSDRLLLPPPAADGGPPVPVVAPPLERSAAAELLRLGDHVAGRMLLVSASLDPRGDTPPAALPPPDPAVGDAGPGPAGAAPAYYSAVAWYAALLTDLARIGPAGDSSAADGRSAEPARGP